MRRSILAVAAAVLACSSPALLTTAEAAPRLTVTSSAGEGAVAAPDGPTTLQVKGTGFQSLPNGFGGVYLMFGWVDDPGGGSWKPSRGGKSGANLLYVPDTEAKNNQGYQRFIAFPGSSTKDAANGGEVGADGRIALTMVIPGPQFTAQDRAGNTKQVDCLKVQCGLITIGAHGVVNASNESFTPISFGKSKGSADAPRAGASPSAPAQGAAVQGAAGSASAAPTGAGGSSAPAAPATVGLSQATVQAGRVLGFTGQGFNAGEQVVATVGSGLAGVGPLTAGRFGEVAGAITLPTDMRAGTHIITLTAAGSGKVAEATLSVMADPATVSEAAVEAQPASDAWKWATVAVAAVAALILVMIVASLVAAISRRGRAKRRGMVRVRRGGHGVGGGQ